MNPPNINFKKDPAQVGVHISFETKSSEDIVKLFKIKKLFLELGIKFDTGAGCGQVNWEWDWSLSGPVQITLSGVEPVVSNP